MSKNSHEKERMEKSLDTLKSRVASLEVVEAERDKMVNENKHLSEEMERYTELQVSRLVLLYNVLCSKVSFLSDA